MVESSSTGRLMKRKQRPHRNRECDQSICYRSRKLSLFFAFGHLNPFAIRELRESLWRENTRKSQENGRIRALCFSRTKRNSSIINHKEWHKSKWSLWSPYVKRNSMPLLIGTVRKKNRSVEDSQIAFKYIYFFDENKKQLRFESLSYIAFVLNSSSTDWAWLD